MSKPESFGEWMTKVQAANHLGLSVDTIERRGIPWQSEPVKFRLRLKYLVLGEDGKGESTRPLPRYFREDVEALLVIPKITKRARKLFEPAYALTGGAR